MLVKTEHLISRELLNHSNINKDDIRKIAQAENAQRIAKELLEFFPTEINDDPDKFGGFNERHSVEICVYKPEHIKHSIQDLQSLLHDKKLKMPYNVTAKLLGVVRDLQRTYKKEPAKPLD